MTVSSKYKALGVWSQDDKVFLCYQDSKCKPNEFRVDVGSDGKNFARFGDANINFEGDKKNDFIVSSFRFLRYGDSYRLLYLNEVGGNKYLNLSESNDFLNWVDKGRLYPITETSIGVPSFTHKNKEVLFFGGLGLSIALEENHGGWNTMLLGLPKKDYEVALGEDSLEGPVITFFQRERHDEHNHFSIWSILLDSKNPTRVLWKTSKEIWLAPQEWINKDAIPVGIVRFSENLISYWYIEGKGIFYVIHPSIEKNILEKSDLPHAQLIKFHKNPILAPHPDRIWESKQVFNPAAVKHEGKVHLLYRAIGAHDTSVLGYATSSDGINIDKRYARPAYVPREKFEHPCYGKKIKTSPFESGGGGYGGIEDPRITKLGDRFYLTYVAYDGSTPPRVALSYITVKDFDDKNWKAWSKPVLITPPGEVDKNASILPEKVNDKYVVFHRIYPDILIDFVDDLDFDGKSVWLKGEYRIHPRPDFWDSNKIGMGPPPIKTKDGWLAIYQGVGFQDNSRYKIGAMLLDLNDPTKVLYRCSRPILEPEEHYENCGFKSGVVYPCGAVIIDDTLIVYYGGSDTYIAAATANLNEFLDALKFDKMPHVDPINLENIQTADAETN